MCSAVLPSLRSVVEAVVVESEEEAVVVDGSEQMVACHLYDPRFNAEPPSMSELARKYEALTEESV
jgi:hypothetical protein